MSATTDKPRKRGLTRRRFLIGSAVVAGGGLALTWWNREQDSLRSSADILEPNAFLQITPDGRFIFQLDKVEMGQGTMTGLTVLVAEELDVDPGRFEVQFAPVLPVFQRPIQITGQSRSMIDSWEILRETGAAARAMLLNAAAARWSVPVTSLQTRDGLVVHPDSGQRLEYAALAADAAQQAPPWNVRLKDPADYRWIGKPVPRLDAAVKVAGKAVYGLDVQLDGMLTAVIARCPELGAKLTSFDASQAEGMPGVRGIVPLDWGVAVVGEDFWSAEQAAATVTLEWQPGALADKADAVFQQEQRAQFERAESEADYAEHDGDTGLVLDESADVLDVEYTTPYLAHATMEPMNATVHVHPDSCEIWVPAQGPDIVRQVACDLLGLPRSAVTVNTTYLGGGFGRRFMWDYVVEAVLVAREFGVPVKLVWTREDDIQNGYFRQLTVHRMRGALGDAGEISAWEHRQAVAPTGELLTPPTISTLLPEALSAERRAQVGQWLGKKTVDWMGAFQAREGAVTVPYKSFSRSFIQFVNDPGVPISIWRSVGNSYNAFVIESFVDELAHMAEEDPLRFRRGRLIGHERHLHVLDELERYSGWTGVEVTEGSARYRGLAIYECFGSVVGQVAEVSIDTSSRIAVHKVFCVVDCGLAVTPDIVKQQMESGIIFGLSAALYGEINIDNGRVRQSNFHDYPVLRLHDSPDIEVHIVASEADPAGVGEPATAVIAPAIANAVFAATGSRLRSLPLKLPADIR